MSSLETRIFHLSSVWTEESALLFRPFTDKVCLGRFKELKDFYTKQNIKREKVSVNHLVRKTNIFLIFPPHKINSRGGKT